MEHHPPDTAQSPGAATADPRRQSRQPGFILDFLFPLRLPVQGLARPIGLLLVVAAVTVAALAVKEMLSAGTPLDVRKPTTNIVGSGVFARSRNPIYLGMVLLCLGIALLAGSFWLLVCTAVFAVILEKGVIAAEESYLEQKFNDEYRRYKARVRRWI